MDAAKQSRLGSDLCSGLPWLSPEDLETPRGMLERPPNCKWPKICAADRVCWMAKQRELAAQKVHGRFLKREAGDEPGKVANLSVAKGAREEVEAVEAFEPEAEDAAQVEFEDHFEQAAQA